jgi:NAD(P)H-dependent FMN reductase
MFPNGRALAGLESKESNVVRILVINGTTRVNRFSAKVGQWVVESLSDRSGLEVELLDLRDYPLPFFDGVSPAYTGRKYPSEDIARFAAKIDRADGYILLTAEYNHGYPAVLKNAMDHTFVEWHRKPVAFVGWGNVGGARAIEQLRGVSVEFEMAPLRHAVHILPDLMVLAMQAPDPFDTSLFASLDGKLDALAADLTWWATNLAHARASD